MRQRAAALLTAALIAGSLAVGGPTAAQTVSEQPFSAYASGTALGINAVGAVDSQVAGVHAAHSAAAVNSQSLAGGLTDDLGQNVHPDLPDHNSYGRGAGLEVGLVVPDEQQQETLNQVILTQLAEAAAPPNSTDEAETTLNLGVINASLLRGEAAANWNPDFCIIGKPLSYGRGMASGLEVLPPLVETEFQGDNVSESRSVTYLIPNGDGTFGVVAETRQDLAPIKLSDTLALIVDGPIVMRAIATGKPGGASVTPVGNPVITLQPLNPLNGDPLGPPLLQVNLQDVVGPSGLDVNLLPLIRLQVGVLNAAAAADGTSAIAQFNTVRLEAVSLPGVLELADVALGHMEANITVPAGGLKCNIPIAKDAAPDPVQVGEDFTITITIPRDVDEFRNLFGCDLINIRATDFHEVLEGNADFVLDEASNGGVISEDGSTVTWENLGNYRIGDPPITLTVRAHIPGNAGAGVLQDTVTVVATLGNCTGEGFGQDIVGEVIGTLTNTGVTGTITLIGPEVSGGVLAATGTDQRWPLLGGAGLILAAMGVRRLRKPKAVTPTS